MQNHHHSEGHKSSQESCCKDSSMKGWKKHHGHRPHRLIHFALFLIIIYFFPWSKIGWGTLNLGSQSTISVSGTAEGTQKNQIASFNAGVTIENEDKEAAVQEVNVLMEELIDQLKAFGISDDDIQTQRVNVSETYIEEETEVLSFPPREPRGAVNGWRVSNTINITLRDVGQASELTDILNKSGATNIYGPNFRVDDTDQLEKELLQAALDDAREKAESMLENSGQKVGEIIRLSEGFNNDYGRTFALAGELQMDGGRTSAPIEPGSQEISKTVTVVFEIK